MDHLILLSYPLIAHTVVKINVLATTINWPTNLADQL